MTTLLRSFADWEASPFQSAASHPMRSGCSRLPMRSEAGLPIWPEPPRDAGARSIKFLGGTAVSSVRSDHGGLAPVAAWEDGFLARVFIISNRVAIPNPARGIHAGGLEVALRATLKRHPCVWLGWSGAVKPAGEIETRTITHRDNSYIVTDLSEEDYHEYYNGFANRVLWP